MTANLITAPIPCAWHYAKILNGRNKEEDANAWLADDSVESWALKAYGLAKTVTYNGVSVPPTTVEDSKTDHAAASEKLAVRAGDLDVTYVDKGRLVVDEQLMKAGVHLANLLDKTFGQNSLELVDDTPKP